MYAMLHQFFNDIRNFFFCCRCFFLTKSSDFLKQMFFSSLLIPCFTAISTMDFVVVVLLFYVHGKHLSSCRDGQLA